MRATHNVEEDHRLRSNFVRALVQGGYEANHVIPRFAAKPPRRIVQFWDNPSCFPGDVRDCINSWRQLEAQGISLILFSHEEARSFIAAKLGMRHLAAYDRCYHPAMQSDYFRLCYILLEGGCYVDADDIYSGCPIGHLFEDGRLKVQPLCYNTANDEMVCPSVFTKLGANSDTWIFYLNNNPIIAGRGHPIIRRALMSATVALERPLRGELPEIQSTTGPGNLTKSVFDCSMQHEDVTDMLLIVSRWEEIALSKWPLSYRGDTRNWRLANQRPYGKSSPAILGDGGEE